MERVPCIFCGWHSIVLLAFSGCVLGTLVCIIKVVALRRGWHVEVLYLSDLFVAQQPVPQDVREGCASCSHAMERRRTSGGGKGLLAGYIQACLAGALSILQRACIICMLHPWGKCKHCNASHVPKPMTLAPTHAQIGL